MQLQGGLELFLEHVLQACVQVSGKICMVPLENVLYIQSNRNNVTECLALSMGVFTEVLPLCGCLTFLKANDSPGSQTGIVDLWMCAQCTGGPLHEVFLCMCTGSTCFVVIAGVEGVMVLKEVFEWYWALYWNYTGTISVANLAGSGRRWRYHLMYHMMYLYSLC